MRVSFRWLAELVELPEDVTPDEVADRLTFAGLEVEAIEDQAEDLENVVVARVQKKGAHPGADRLSLLEVDTGGEVVPIVCGATNFKEGDLVVLARPGAFLPDGTEIEVSEIRGVTSHGMLCSPRELGLGDDHTGLLILDAHAGVAPGALASDALMLDDVILEIGVTPNRPDALSHVGVAREVAAIFGTRARLQTQNVAERGRPIDDVAQVEIRDPDGCPRYGCRVIEDVLVGPSPDWLVRRLASCGVRSINNIVDVTNFVMMERGIPLHAFDLYAIAKERGERATVIVRRAEAGEKLVTLDEVERELLVEDLIIADPKGPIAIAGVMGGRDSEVTGETTSILLEGANFFPGSVRRTARRLGIHSEASHRFERGCDPNGVRQSLDRAAALIAELTEGVVARGVVDVYPRKIEETVIALRPGHTAQLLGVPPKVVDEAVVSKLLLSLGLEVVGREADAVRFRVPTFRPDLEREVDLIEEVVRLIGYDAVPATLPARRGEAHGLYDSRRHHVEDMARAALEAAGYCEAINLAFTSPAAQAPFDGGDEATRVVIQNPLGEDMSLMRSSLLPGLLGNAALNVRRGHAGVRLYELGTVFAGKNPDGKAPRIEDDGAPEGGDAWAIERPMLSAVACGQVGVSAFDRAPQPIDLYDLKGALESAFERVGIDVHVATGRFRLVPEDEGPAYLHPRSRASVCIDDIGVGFAGEIHPDVLKQYDLKGPVLAFEVMTERLAAAAPTLPRSEPPPRFPAVKRDFALVLDEGVAAGEVCRELAASAAVAGLLEDLAIFDIYRGEHVPEGKKSLALSVTLRAADRTLTEDEVTSAADALVATARDRFGAEIRS